MTDAPHRGHYFGLFLGLVAGSAWGTTSVASRYLAHYRGVNPMLSVFFRLALALPLLCVAVRLWAGGARRFERKDLPKIVVLSALGVFLMSNFVFFATRYTTNINLTIIMTASAILIGLIARARGETVTRSQWAGILVGLAGVSFIATAMNPGEKTLTLAQHAAGIGLATLGSLSWALYTYFGSPMVEKYGGLKTTVWAIAVGALMQTVVVTPSGVLRQAVNLSPGDWAVLIYVAVVPTALAFTVWFVALKYIDAPTLGMCQYVGPVINAILGLVLLKEPLLWQHYAGAALIFAGLHFAAKSPAPPAPKPQNP